MEKHISGEVYNLDLPKIKNIFKQNFDIPIREKSIEELYIENEEIFLDIYDNSQSMKNTFLIGGVFKGNYDEGIEFINTLSNLFLQEKVSFELEIEENGNRFNIKNRVNEKKIP